MKNFFFGIMAYNEQDYIIETLESIKYQVQEYGKGISVDLVVIDDCSKDLTAEYANKWVDNNIGLFHTASVLKNYENIGTVCNYNKLIQKANGSQFKILAGDDIFGSRNIFEMYSGLDSSSITSFCELTLTDGIVGYKKLVTRNYYYEMKKRVFNDDYYVNHYRISPWFSTPSSIYTKELYDSSGCKDYNSQFKLVEDMPSFYRMLQNSGTKVKLFPFPIVLYRVRSTSTSHKKNNSPYHRDKNKIYRDYVVDARGLWKVIIKSKYFSHLPTALRLSTIYTRIRSLWILLYSMFSLSYGRFISALNKDVLKEQEHFNLIHDRACAFLNNNFG